MPEDGFSLFSGTSHPELAEKIANSLGTGLGKVVIKNFPDGEIGAQILESVRGQVVFVIQSIARQPNFYLMELLILIDALKRASASKIVAVISYYGYARQDRKDKGRVPITAKLVADLLEKAGATRVVTMDLHSEQIQGFFDVPVDNLYARPVLVKALHKEEIKNPILVAPDIGSIKLARTAAFEMGADFAMIDKRRLVNSAEVEVEAIIGDVQGRNVVLVDDICSTGETLRKGAVACKQAGARRIFAAVTHGIFNEGQFEGGEIEKLFVTNTIPLPSEINLSLIEVVCVAKLFGHAIKCIFKNASIASPLLFAT